MELTESYKKRLSELSGIISEIDIDDIQIPKKYLQDELNPKIWNHGELNPEVREQLLKIALEFYKFLEINAEIKDIKLLGSMASYNWTQFSDIDIHLVFRMKDISNDEEFALKFLDAKIQLWREKYNDIEVRGFPVELYAQRIEDNYYRSGVYSLLNGSWEKEPVKEKVIIDTYSLKNKIKSIGDMIENLETMQTKNKPEHIYELATRLADKIKRMRGIGLNSIGEFSLENLTFKYLRNYGFIKKLIDLRNRAFNEKLSMAD